MRDADDAIVLTDREREALAGLAQSIGDPWLARQLVGRDDPPPDRKRRPPVRLPARPGPVAAWVGVLMVLGGAALAVTSFIFSTVLASLGLVVMGVGLWRLVVDHADGIISRLTARRTAVPQPSAPHTPPGAA